MHCFGRSFLIVKKLKLQVFFPNNYEVLTIVNVMSQSILSQKEQ